MRKYWNSTTMFLETTCEADVLGVSVNDVFESYVRWCKENDCYTFEKCGLSKEIKKKYGFVVKRKRVNGKLVGFYCEV